LFEALSLNLRKNSRELRLISLKLLMKFDVLNFVKLGDEEEIE